MPTLWLTASFLLAIAQATAPPGPAAKPVDVSTPQDAKERMALAEKVNGLAGLGVPWHLKATYEVMAAGASTPEKGTYEEWHGTGKQDRAALHGSTTSVEEYSSEQGEFRVGTQDWPLLPVSAIRNMINNPVALKLDPEQFSLRNYERKLGPDTFQCTALMFKKFKVSPENAESFCFLPTNAVLLLKSDTEKVFQTVFEHSSWVHGQYLPRDMQMFLGGVPWMKVHVELLESLAPAALIALIVPPDAHSVTSVLFRGDVRSGRLKTNVVPSYPVAAKQVGVEGTVILDCVIDKTGHISKVVALAGPTLLQQPAVDAVRQWVYEPFLLNGLPVETETQVHVIFRLGS